MTIPSHRSEVELIRKARRQDTAAIKALYDAYVQYLVAVCKSYIASDDDVKDVLQESFLKIFSSLDKFEWRGEGSLKSWMRRIVVNEALMFLRRNAKLATESLDKEFAPGGFGDVSGSGVAGGSGTSSGFGTSFDVAEETADGEPDVAGVPMQVLLGMIRGLPEGYRTVFNLYVFEEKSHKEIAEILGIVENTSYSQFSRAKSLLARKIKEYKKKQA